MIDPHVVSIKYQLKTNERYDYEAPPITGETEIFRFCLERDELVLEFKTHYATIEDAQLAVANFLRSWELDVAIKNGINVIKFLYKDADIIDRNPIPSNVNGFLVQSLQTAGMVAMAGTLTIKITKKEYPAPPSNFRVSPEVELLWNRYERCIKGQEPLLAMAYFCLTFLETIGGREGMPIPIRGQRIRPEEIREEAANTYFIDLDILKTLGELTSTRGDQFSARKVQNRAHLLPLNEKEVIWIQEAIKKIIQRVGELGTGASLQLITMNDLPPL